jgi:hypothetical protein
MIRTWVKTKDAIDTITELTRKYPDVTKAECALTVTVPLGVVLAYLAGCDPEEKVTMGWAGLEDHAETVLQFKNFEMPSELCLDEVSDASVDVTIKHPRENASNKGDRKL